MPSENFGGKESKGDVQGGNLKSPPTGTTGSDDGGKADKGNSMSWLGKLTKKVSRNRRALFIGLDRYESMPDLHCCANDARAMATKLATHGDASDNFRREVLVSPGSEPITRAAVRRYCEKLFSSSADEVLFYFSGHGVLDDSGGFLVTEDGEIDDPGIYLDELLTLADRSIAKAVTLILDTCFADNLGNPALLQKGRPSAVLRDGVTILAASRGVAVEGREFGLFTEAVLQALDGGAADALGNISAASVYVYVEQLLGMRGQRPIYKSYANTLQPLRQCVPEVSEELLLRLTEIFPTVGSTLRLDRSYEFTFDSSLPENVRVFTELKKLRNVGFLVTEEEKDLYYLAVEGKRAWLSSRGRFYWRLVASSK